MEEATGNGSIKRADRMSTMLTGRIPLFHRVDYEITWTWVHYSMKPHKSTVAYYHYCDPEYIPNRIEESGTCNHCGTYIASYKKLDTILGLKNLTS